MLLRLLLALLLISAQSVGALCGLAHATAHAPGHATDRVDTTVASDTATVPKERCAACEVLFSVAPPPTAGAQPVAGSVHHPIAPVPPHPAPAPRHDGPGAGRDPPTHA